VTIKVLFFIQEFIISEANYNFVMNGFDNVGNKNVPRIWLRV